jgi:hypothetical protein
LLVAVPVEQGNSEAVAVAVASLLCFDKLPSRQAS